MITKLEALKNLYPHLNKELLPFADQYGIKPFGKDNKGGLNKGWTGQTLERMAGLPNSTKREPDGKDFDLKACAHKWQNGSWIPKETLWICSVKNSELISDDFYSSQVWKKFRSMIVCATTWEYPGDVLGSLIKIVDFNANSLNKQIIDDIEEDYNSLRTTLINRGFSALRSTDGKYLQTRTKGPGNGSTSRAFYIRNHLVRIICKSTTIP